MVLDVNLVLLVHHSHEYWVGRLIKRVIDTSYARNDPDQIVAFESFAHELCHDTQATNLDLDAPIFNVVLHGCDQNAAPDFLRRYDSAVWRPLRRMPRLDDTELQVT